MRNLTMLTDFYELSMMNAYLESGMADRIAIFDLFYRPAPTLDFAVAAGLEQAVELINNLHFSDDDIAYLRSLNVFGEDFFRRIKNFRFTGDIYAVREGEIIFPHEPIVTVRAKLFEAQLIETALLNIINHQTLIATKSMRITQETDGAVAEFGLRRAQGPDAGIYGTRASIIGGCKSTSNVYAGQMFGIKVSGTHAHSWVMSFPSEIEAFRKYAEIYPDNCILLVDTYDTLRSGVPNAITVFNELKAKGKKPLGIRLDSGDLAYLSKQARRMLDEAGHEDVKIFASGDIDEYIIAALRMQEAKIDVWGIGTKLITSYPQPSLGGVYKLAALEENGVMVPKMKVSDTPEKITNPGFKTTYRIYGADGMAAADLIALREERFDTSEPLTIFHPLETWKKKTFTKYAIKDLMVKVFEDGRQVYDIPDLTEIVRYANKSKNEFWEEYKRLVNPHSYKVDLSEGLYNLKQQLLNDAK
ncbi:MAG: nicotinate phosphoribosyltransferase [Clostridiales bacterium]|jgi:nicotinate phosphoribosyltransferase|nr:nicotinate phosphoribosyltransferase [Clostridiales bacterium]HOK81751.1 nicotinate phosphoribosyltransferase [Clostridia bacterium]HOL60648.1 nicotinate phosphoribosyltransferase [Clostridia bacterium]HPO53055.1 nicotinate phosphoribosyltransferase [Clostridia bacterium]